MSQLDPDTAFLFDVGNVILFFDFSRFTRAIEADCDFTAQQLLEMIEEPKAELEAGICGSEVFLDRIFEAIGYRGSETAFTRAWQEIFDLNKPIADWIAELSDAGHLLFLLSNTNQLHADYFLKEYPVFERFDSWVLSHEAGCSKPDPEIFHHAIDKFDLNPSQTIYLDDLEQNIAAGVEAGLRSVRYHGQPPAEVVRQALNG